jgi:hypothetical protein
MMGIEPMTSSLPRKRSTPELHRPKNRAGNEARTRDPSAWKADALPTELLPQLGRFYFLVGGGGFEPPKA